MHLFVKKHLSSSLIVELILRSAIIFRKIIAFANVYKLVLISIVADFLLFAIAVLLAERIYSNQHWIGFPSFAIPLVYFVPAVLQIIISSLAGAYKKKSFLILRMIVSLLSGMIILSALTYFFKQVAFSRAVVLITYAISFISFSFWRVAAKIIFKVGSDTDTKRNRTLIVAGSRNAQELISKLKLTFTRIYHVVGIIGLNRKEIGERIINYKVLGTVENIKKIISDECISKVIFSSEDIPFNQLFSVVSECQGLNVEFLVAGTEMDFLVGKSAITMLDDIPLLKVQYNISSLSHQSAKRIFDLCFSTLILFLIYPFIYLFQKLTSKKSKFIQFILGIPKVFVGKKSFVGPFSDSYQDELFIGKAGLTGFWFTENYAENDYEELKKLDIFYAKNQSIWLDFEILGKSFSKMFINME